jgi:hypothetical protein
MSDRLAGRLVVGLEGARPTPDEIRWLAAHRPAGVILFARNILDYNKLWSLCRGLKALVPGLEIVADHEGGPVSALAGALGRPPAAWTLGALDDVDLTRRVWAETGRRLRDAGVDRVLAPVCDVLTAPRNPVIGVRAFSDDAERCLRHVAAAVEGCAAQGVAMCAKHWPGHGAAWTDSHDEPARLDHLNLWRTFEIAMTRGVDALMVGHLLPAEAAADAAPATLDADLLRARKRRGADSDETVRLYADDITMGALRPAMRARGIASGDDCERGLADPGRLSRAWIAALADAGCDRLLVRGIPWTAFPAAAPAAAVWPETIPAPGVEWDDRPYAEARLRAWRRGAAPFLAEAGDVIWDDRTVGDRWEPADGGARGAAALGAALGGLGLRVRTARDGAAGTGSCDRLLVTSHRPLPEDWLPPPELAAGGKALAMGHPSLARDLERSLGGGWSVGALYETGPEDLAPAGAPGLDQENKFF